MRTIIDWLRILLSIATFIAVLFGGSSAMYVGLNYLFTDIIGWEEYGYLLTIGIGLFGACGLFILAFKVSSWWFHPPTFKRQK